MSEFTLVILKRSGYYQDSLTGSSDYFRRDRLQGNGRISAGAVHKAEGGRDPDWDLKGLASIYEDVTKVNKGFVQRLRQLPIKDASVNAIIGLDCFAMNINFAITGDMLDDLKDTFTTHLK